LSKNYTRRKNRRRAAIRERNKRRRSKREFIGKCSNCQKKNILVRLIAGSQVCYVCARRLPGHLLRKVFPTVRDPKLTEFLRDHNVVSTTAVERPEEPAEREKTWREKIAAKCKALLKRISPKR
jgi:hypothetical protein